MCNFDHYYLSFCVFSIVVYVCKLLLQKNGVQLCAHKAIASIFASLVT